MGSKTITVGSWGGDGGIRWDDGTHDGIQKVTIFSGACIDSISVEYDDNGEPTGEGKHGGEGGSGDEIYLQYPDEYLVSTSGHFGLVSFAPTPVVRSLTLVSNNGRVFGPYGEEDGTPFSLPIQGGRIVGFTGRSGQFLDAIGFRISPN